MTIGVSTGASGVRGPRISAERLASEGSRRESRSCFAPGGGVSTDASLAIETDEPRQSPPARDLALASMRIQHSGELRARADGRVSQPRGSGSADSPVLGSSVSAWVSPARVIPGRVEPLGLDQQLAPASVRQHDHCPRCPARVADAAAAEGEVGSSLARRTAGGGAVVVAKGSEPCLEAPLGGVR